MKWKAENILGIKNRFLTHTYTHPQSFYALQAIFFDVLNIFCTFWYQNVQNMDFIFNLKVKYW